MSNCIHYQVWSEITFSWNRDMYNRDNHAHATGSISWWRHQMETFSALLAICVGNSPVPGEFPTQRPVTRSFDVYFDLRPNKRLSKQSWCWWFETPSRTLWRHRNVIHGKLSMNFNQNKRPIMMYVNDCTTRNVSWITSFESSNAWL